MKFGRKEVLLGLRLLVAFVVLKVLVDGLCLSDVLRVSVFVSGMGLVYLGEIMVHEGFLSRRGSVLFYFSVPLSLFLLYRLLPSQSPFLTIYDTRLSLTEVISVNAFLYTLLAYNILCGLIIAFRAYKYKRIAVKVGRKHEKKPVHAPLEATLLLCFFIVFLGLSLLYAGNILHALIRFSYISLATITLVYILLVRTGFFEKRILLLEALTKALALTWPIFVWLDYALFEIL